MLGEKPENILLVMSTLKSVNGRLDPIQSSDGYTAIVDYAHTPDAPLTFAASDNCDTPSTTV